MPEHKIALLVEAPDVKGGIQSAAHRHAKLMSAGAEIVPIAFEKSRSEDDWAGRVERVTTFGRDAFVVRAADLSNDHRWSATSSTENIRQDIRFRSYADHLVQIIRDQGITAIHAFGAFHQRGLIAAYAAAKCNLPVILSLRGVDLETRMFDGMLGPLAASVAAADVIVCVSDDARALVQRVFRPSAPVHVVRNHFDPAVFGPQTPVDLPLLRGTAMPVIGCFGKFRRVMGLDFLIDAFDALCRQRDAVLLLGGAIQKREVEYYTQRIDRCAAAANIIRLGNVPHDRMLDYLRLCDAVVYPSISDASPNKVLEAMYAKVPIVSTRTGGIPELVTDEQEALLVPPRSAEAILDALTRVLDEPGLAADLTARAFARVTSEHRIEDEGPLWQAVYDAAAMAAR